MQSHTHTQTQISSPVHTLKRPLHSEISHVTDVPILVPRLLQLVHQDVCNLTEGSDKLGHSLRENLLAAS